MGGRCAPRAGVMAAAGMVVPALARHLQERVQQSATESAMTKPHLPLLVLPLALWVSACMPVPRSAMEAVPAGADERTETLASVKDAMDGADRAARAAAIPMFATQTPPAITGLGFAQISGQPGKTVNEKRLMAIRAARLDAMRDLTEQIHGIRIDSETTIRDMVVQNDQLTALIQGTLRGARTVYIKPKDADAYEVKMAVDRDTVGYILQATRGQL